MKCSICKEEKELVYGSPCCKSCEDEVWEKQLEASAMKLSWKSPLSLASLNSLSEKERMMAMEIPDRFSIKDHE